MEIKLSRKLSKLIFDSVHILLVKKSFGFVPNKNGSIKDGSGLNFNRTERGERAIYLK